MEKFLSNDGLEVLIGGLDPRYAKEKDLASVAKSGSYNDLSDVPSIPSTPGDIDAMPASTTLSDLGGIASTEKGANNGVAPLNAGGKIDSQYLPSYVDDVIECYVVDGYEALSANWLSKTNGGNPLLPEEGKIYVVLSSGDYLNKVFRWGGTTYVSIGGDVDLSAYATQSWVNNQGFLTSHQDISGKADSSSLASVATSGDYDDLVNKPIIPSIPTNVSSFTNDAGYLTSHQDISNKANKSDLATVATTGDYEDLIHLPTIPTIPTNVSSFINDAGYLTQHQDISGKVNSSDLATVATTGDYEDLVNTPTIPTIPTLATVATSGSYNDLSDKPTIPQGNFVEKDSNGNIELYNSQANSFYLTNYDNLILGDNNHIQNSNSSLVLGLNHSLTSDSAVALIGNDLSSNTNYALHVGQHNHPGISGHAFVFSVGNGSTNNNSNAFAIDKTTGNILLAGDVYIGCNDWSQEDGGGTLLEPFSGDYNDLDNLPTLFSGSYNDLTDQPRLFSGNYNDLTNKPTIQNLQAGYGINILTRNNNQYIDIDSSYLSNQLSSYVQNVWNDGSFYYYLNTQEVPGFKVKEEEEYETGSKPGRRDIRELLVEGPMIDIVGHEYDENDPETVIGQISYTLDADGFYGLHESYDENGDPTETNSVTITEAGIDFYNEQAPEREGDTPTIVEGQLAFDTGTGNLNWNSEALVTSAKVPDAPTTDGTYMLICEVADGQPSFSWESIAIGGSY